MRTRSEGDGDHCGQRQGKQQHWLMPEHHTQWQQCATYRTNGTGNAAMAGERDRIGSK